MFSFKLPICLLCRLGHMCHRWVKWGDGLVPVLVEHVFSMVKRPTSTYTMSDPQMSTFASDGTGFRNPGILMEEEKTLHGWIWLPISHLTPLVPDSRGTLQFDPYGLYEQPVSQDPWPVSPESWRLVNADNVYDYSPVMSQTSTNLPHDPSRSRMAMGHWPLMAGDCWWINRQW